MPESYPLPSSNLEALGFAQKPLEHLDRLIREHIEQGRYPGAQIALARNGQLALFRSYGDARTEGGRTPASDDTPFLLFRSRMSNAVPFQTSSACTRDTALTGRRASLGASRPTTTRCRFSRITGGRFEYCSA